MSAKRILLVVFVVSIMLLAVGGGPRRAGTVHASLLPPEVDGGAVTVPYAGTLTDSAGRPVADGLYDFSFTLYAAESGGEPLWWEVQKGVMVADGVLDVALGRVTAIPTAVLDGDARWLAVGVRGPAETAFTPLLPRQRLSTDHAAAPTSPTTNGACPHNHLGEVWNASLAWSNAGLRINNSANGPALWGYNSGGGNGVRGESTSNLGVYGWSSSSQGVAGRSEQSHGVYGESQYGPGTAGVYGKNTGTAAGAAYGVWGETLNGDGSAAGVYGMAANGYAIGVYGYTLSSDGWAGMFGSPSGNGVKISVGTGKVGLTVLGGSKNAAVQTDDGMRLLYSEESTEVWFSDYGFGTLQDGAAVIPIDPIFAQTVNLQEPYHVFVQAYGNAELYVTHRTATQFQVHLRDGDPGVDFSYRIVAKRLGYEDHRLERAPWADDDGNLDPEK